MKTHYIKNKVSYIIDDVNTNLRPQNVAIFDQYGVVKLNPQEEKNMKYINAEEVLPKELLTVMIFEYRKRTKVAIPMVS